MATRDDRRAAMLLLVIGLAGAVIRLIGSGGGPPGAIGYDLGADSRPGRDSLEAVSERIARPLSTGERIDLDRADAIELARLPRIGPALAARIVRDRTERGPFGSLEALQRVPGVGPALTESIRPHAAFSQRRRPPVRDRSLKVSLNTANLATLQQLPGIGPSRARAIIDDRRRNGPYRAIEDLARVPGIGTATIEALRDVVTLR